MTDARMPIPALVFWMPMPNYDIAPEIVAESNHFTYLTPEPQQKIVPQVAKKFV
jgi:hypothetical protein